MALRWSAILCQTQNLTGYRSVWADATVCSVERSSKIADRDQQQRRRVPRNALSIGEVAEEMQAPVNEAALSGNRSRIEMRRV